MPRAPPRNVIRSYQTRVQGIFKKATELLELDREIEIAVFVKKQGYTPLIFTVEEGDPNWPCGIEEFITTHRPHVKRPSDYLTLKEGVSKGKALIVSSSPPSPYISSRRQRYSHVKDKTPELSQPFEAPESTGSSPYHHTEASMAGSPYHTQVSMTGSPYRTEVSTSGPPYHTEGLSYPKLDWMQYSRSVSSPIPGGLGMLPSKRQS